MTGLLIDFRVSSAKWAALVAVVVGVAYETSRKTWVGSWSDTIQASTNAFTLALPLILIAAAWDAGRDRSHRSALAPSAASRPMWHIIWSRWLAATGWLFASFAVVLLAAAGMTAKRSPTPTLGWEQLGVTATVIGAYAAIGVLLGRLLPPLAVIPTSMFLGMVLPVTLAYSPGSVGALFTSLDDTGVPIGYRLRPEIAFGQMGWFASIAFLALVTARLVIERHISPRAMLAGLLATGLVASATGALVAERGPRIVPAAANGPRDCEGQPPVCVWRDHGYVLAGVSASASRMLAGSGPWAGRPRGFVESGLIKPDSQWLDFSLNTNNPDSYVVARALAIGTVSRLCATDSLGAARFAREDWLTLRALPLDIASGPVGREVRSIQGRSLRQQWQWFTHLKC